MTRLVLLPAARRVLIVVMLVSLDAPLAAADDTLWTLLRGGRQVVLIRHAITTPGVGDAFRTRGIPVTRVLSSPWCRCVETAQLAYNAYEVSLPLSNLFGRPEARDGQVRQLLPMLGAHRPGGNHVLVTHGSTIQAVTGINPDTAEMVIVTPQGGDRFAVAGRLRVP